MRQSDYPSQPEWLLEHRRTRPYTEFSSPSFTPARVGGPEAQSLDGLVRVAETAFNNHARQAGAHISPFDTGLIEVGTDGLEVRLAQGINLESLKQVVAAGSQATIGRPRPEGAGPWSDYLEIDEGDWREMFKGGLQAALESQTLVFEVWGASRILTHQLVRSRRAGFHQQSQRSTWYGDRPEVRMPETVWRASEKIRALWVSSYQRSWDAYKAACDAGVPYEDARYILPEGTVNYIQCEYTIREFINVFAYRGCSMFLREMVVVMRAMRDLVIATAPELAPYIKISCEKGSGCPDCRGTGLTQDDVPGMAPHYGGPCPTCDGTGGRKCTFQGWENVELACDFPWARESNRTFVALPKLRIGAKNA